MSPKSATAKLPCGRPIPEKREHHTPSKDKLVEWKDLLQKYMESEKLKSSDQRWKIAETILTMGGHLDAQGIVELVHQKDPTIGAATVYRNLKVLCDAGILKESLTDREGRVMYEPVDEEHHDHIICVDCGEIFEFHDDQIESQQSQVAREMKFEEVRHRHVVYARCAYKKK
ncbi:MAG: Fur family transcriptional regulator [Bdellovibrionota bacterium]